MAVKKTELYSSLWASCDALRGGMDASQYKDYILTLLFMKYVTDKYKGREYRRIRLESNGSLSVPNLMYGLKVEKVLLNNWYSKYTTRRFRLWQ